MTKLKDPDINAVSTQSSLEIECLKQLLGNEDVQKTELLARIDVMNQFIEEYMDTATKTISKQDEILALYKGVVKVGSLLGGMLSLSERNAIRAEVVKAKALFNLNLRGKEILDLTDKFDPLLFSNLVRRLRDECPTITNILEQFVLTYNTSKNKKKDANMKMKAAVHLLASLLDVRDQRGGNDIPVLFGLLCLCYGAGPSMIGMFQHLGLSESFPIL